MERERKRQGARLLEERDVGEIRGDLGGDEEGGCMSVMRLKGFSGGDERGINRGAFGKRKKWENREMEMRGGG